MLSQFSEPVQLPPSNRIPARAMSQSRFDENETRFISATNAGELLDLIPNEFWSVSLEEGSVFENEEYVTSATIDQLVDEAAARGGMISFTINDPAIWSKNISIIQQW